MPTHREGGEGITGNTSARALSRRKYDRAKADRDAEALRAAKLSDMSRKQRAEALAAERIAEQALKLIDSKPRGRPLLTVTESASYAGVSRWTIQRLIRSGELRYVTRQGRRAILPSDLDRIFREVAS